MVCSSAAVYKADVNKDNNNNIRLLKIDKPQLNTEMLNVKVIHT